MSEIRGDVSFFVKQFDELAESFRVSLASNVLSGIGLFGYFMTLNELLMVVSIFSAVLSSIVSMTSLYRFFVFLRDRNREVSSRQSIKQGGSVL
jgi:hypothetical protein